MPPTCKSPGCIQARQLHLIWVGSQVSACSFAIISRGRCTYDHSVAHEQTCIRPYPLCFSQCDQLCILHRLPPHDRIIATPQDRSACHGLVAPCFPHLGGLHTRCTSAGQPLAAPQAVGHHTAVGQHTALLGLGRIARSPLRTSQPRC